MMAHQKQWQKIQSALLQQRTPQAMLFVGPLHCNLSEFTKKIIQTLLCKEKINKPCAQCAECRMLHAMEHPDVQWIKPEKNSGPIKIDQIRDLHHFAYLTPQRATYKLVVIESADRMNNASANALLKILEEPAEYTIFILIAQQISTVLPTILSRCQITSFSSSSERYEDNWLLLGEHYPLDSERALITQQAQLILEGLIAVFEGREHPCALAMQWSQYELDALLWLLYLAYSQLLSMHFRRATVKKGPAIEQLTQLASLLKPLIIFKQMDKINALLRKINHNVTINQLLALEDLLFF